MTKSRKLIIALVLLAGGYGLAIVLSGLTDYLDPGGTSAGSARSDSGGLLTTLKELVPHHDISPEGRLVPESEYVASHDQRSNVESLQWNNHPTWLVSTPATNSEPPTASQPTFAAAPMLSEYPPPEPAPLAPTDSAERMPRPVARITNVVGLSSDASPRAGVALGPMAALGARRSAVAGRRRCH